jgi:hypothetical protein
VYDEIVLWRKNMFMLQSGAAGKQYVREKTRLLNLWNDQSVLFENIAIKMTMIMPALLLQKPLYKSTSKQHASCLARRIILWEKGDFDALTRECRTIQSKLRSFGSTSQPNSVSKKFTNMMLQGKVNPAMRLLEQEQSSGVINVNSDTLKELRDKHPVACPPNEAVMLKGEIPIVDPVMFDALDESMIMNAALRTKGVAGSSGMDS